MSEEKKVITISTLSNDQKLYTENVVNDMQLKIKHLQEENEGLKSLNDFNVQKIEVLQEENERLNQELDIKEKMLDKFMIGSGETLEKLQKENEKLKARLKTLDDEVLTIEITPDEFERYKKYKQALEEIRVFSENFCEDKCPFYENEYSEVCNEACLLDNIVNPILKKIDGVLNDRD